MNVLLIGSGGREHALAFKIHQSPTLDEMFILPGNPGTEKLGRNISLDENNFEKIYSFCVENNIELVVIGPEIPLVNGMADFLKERGVKVFGPDKSAAEIEAHKSFAKHLMKKYGIPTADFAEFDSEHFDSAREYLKNHEYPCVIKADGLAAGKGVLICRNFNEAEVGLNDIFIERKFGKSGDKIVIEEFLTGEEASIFAVTDGNDYVCLPSSQDHKRIGEGDTGKNTGGMGAYSPAPVVTDELMSYIENEIIKPTIIGMRNEGRHFTGCLYCGLMIDKNEAKVVEYNCRFGDPETQAVLPLLEGDFLKLLYSAAYGKIDKDAVRYNGGSSVCVVASSKGYPEHYEKGYEIDGLDLPDEDIIIYHAGTKRINGKTFTSGGRVLGITSFIKRNDLKEAKAKAYNALNKINFNGIYFRKDIADKAINKL